MKNKIPLPTRWIKGLERRPEFLLKPLIEVEKPMRKELHQSNVIGYLFYSESRDVYQVVIDNIRVGLITRLNLLKLCYKYKLSVPIKLP